MSGLQALEWCLEQTARHSLQDCTLPMAAHYASDCACELDINGGDLVDAVTQMYVELLNDSKVGV